MLGLWWIPTFHGLEDFEFVILSQQLQIAIAPILTPLQSQWAFIFEVSGRRLTIGSDLKLSLCVLQSVIVLSWDSEMLLSLLAPIGLVTHSLKLVQGLYGCIRVDVTQVQACYLVPIHKVTTFGEIEGVVQRASIV